MQPLTNPGFGIGVLGSGCRVQGSGSRVCVVGWRRSPRTFGGAQGAGFMVQGLRCALLDFMGVEAVPETSRVQGKGAGFGVWRLPTEVWRGEAVPETSAIVTLQGSCVSRVRLPFRVWG